MNILDIFGAQLKEVFSQNEQSTNELLIELATFFYKIDKRITLEEQEYMDGMMGGIEWVSPTCIESYQDACIGRVNKIVGASESEIHNYLTQIMESFEKLDSVEQAKSIAREISEADGEIADDEAKYLQIVMAFA